MKSTRKTMKRGAVTSATSEMLAAWIPKQLALQLDTAVNALDTDRSKFLRAAIREHLARITPHAQ